MKHFPHEEPIIESERRARKVQVRDHALDAIRRADAFTVIAVVDGEARTFRFAENMEQVQMMFLKAAERFTKGQL